MRTRVAAIASGLSVVAAVAVGVWQSASACIYKGVNEVPAGSGAPVEEEYCAGSLIDVNGPSALIALAVPVIISLGGWLSIRARKRAPVWAAVILLLIFSVLGAASVGIFYLPSFLLLAVGAAISSKESPPGPVDDSVD